MSPSRSFVLALLASAALWAPALDAVAAPKSRPAQAGLLRLARLAEYMVGSFSSAAQAAQDTNYFDIRLEMVRIWPERTDGIWLYVEQAAAGRLDRPYRQRVYHLEAPGDTVLLSSVFTLPDPLRFAGAFRDSVPLRALTPDSLAAREGCEIHLKSMKDNTFEGSTRGRECPSDLRGAAYATSSAWISATELRSWDQGFDGAGRQVWGATAGPYRFLKSKRR